jgi:fructoselysine-6-P-deglycase FrlB-like protein
MPWCFDRSVCQTRTVSCLYLAGMLLIAGLGGNETLFGGLTRAVAGGPAYMARIEDDLKRVAKGPWTRAVVLADAEIAGIGAEAALAFQEICQRPGSFHNVLDVRHGPMVLIGPDTLVIVALADGNQYELALLADLAKKGPTLIAYSDIPLYVLPDGTLNINFGRSLPHAARGLPLALIAQLVSYHRAVADGVNPDEPAGLDPWIRL